MGLWRGLSVEVSIYNVTEVLGTRRFAKPVQRIWRRRVNDP